MYAQLGQILDTRYNEAKKPNCHVWRAWRKNHGTLHDPCIQHHKRMGKPPKPALRPDPWTNAYHHPIYGTNWSLLSKKASKWTCCLFSRPCLAHPNKHLPEKNISSPNMCVSISGYSILSSYSIDLFFYHTQLIIVVLVVQSLLCSTLCSPMDCSTPDFPVLHYIPELA